MTKLAELASLIRSKNADPFVLTFDIMFSQAARYDRVKRAGVLGPAMFARLYRCAPESVRFCLRQRARV